MQIKDFHIMAIKAENLSLKMPTLNQAFESLYLKATKSNPSEMNNSLQSDNRINDIQFLQKCLIRIEKLEAQNAKYKRLIKLKDVGLESKFEAKKLDKNKQYFTLTRENETLKMENLALEKKLKRMEREVWEREQKKRGNRREKMLFMSASPKRKKGKIGKSGCVTSMKKKKRVRRVMEAMEEGRKDLSQILDESLVKTDENLSMIFSDFFSF
jgi:hypothetical protein